MRSLFSCLEQQSRISDAFHSLTVDLALDSAEEVLAVEAVDEGDLSFENRTDYVLLLNFSDEFASNYVLDLAQFLLVCLECFRRGFNLNEESWFVQMDSSVYAQG